MFKIEEILKFLLFDIPWYFIKEKCFGLPIIKFLKFIQLFRTVIDLSPYRMPICKYKHNVLPILHQMLRKLLEVIFLLGCHDILTIIKNKQ